MAVTAQRPDRARRFRVGITPLIACLSGVAACAVTDPTVLDPGLHDALSVVNLLPGALGFLVGFGVERWIDFRTCSPVFTWRRKLAVTGTVVGCVSSAFPCVLLGMQTAIVSPLVCVVATCGMAVVGARIGDVIDRRREITGRSADADQQP